MSEIHFIGSPAKHGDYFIFQIPNKLIKSGLVDPKDTFFIKIEPIRKEISKTKTKTIQKGEIRT